MWNEEKKAKARRQASTDWQKKYILYRMKMKEEKKYFQENENTKKYI
jgi:hypothetical protein